MDGFLSAAAAAAAGWSGLYGVTAKTGVVGRTIAAGIVGGTTSALGGGKFANGFYTAAFQHLLNAELRKGMEWKGVKLDYERKSGILKYWDHIESEWVTIGEFQSGHFEVGDETLKGAGPTPRGSYRIYTRGKGVAWAYDQPGYILDPDDKIPYNDRWDGGPASGRGNLRIHAGYYRENQSEGCLIAPPNQMKTIHAIFAISAKYSPYTRTIGDWKDETALGTLKIR